MPSRKDGSQSSQDWSRKDMSPKAKRIWFFVLANLPEELRTWQCLKDFVRNSMKRNGKPGWTDVDPDTHNAYFWVTSASDARAVFASLDEKYPKTLIHYYGLSNSGKQDGSLECNCHTVFKTTGHSEEFTGPWLTASLRHGWDIFQRSCQRWPSNTGERLASSGALSMATGSPDHPAYAAPAEYYGQMPQTVPTAYPVDCSYNPSATVAYTEMNHAYINSCSPYATSSQWSASPPLTASVPIAPRQYTDTWGIQINAGEHEPVKTVSLGVLITNLHFKMKKWDLEEVLNKNGYYNFSKIDFKTDKKGLCSGTAIVTFLGSHDATAAAAALDKYEWRDRAMSARVDKNRIPVTGTNPPVVNGST